MFNGYAPTRGQGGVADEKAILAKAEQTLVGLLQHCDRIELQKIHDSSSTLDEMIAANILDDALRDLKNQKDQVLAQTRQLAEANLQKQPIFAQAKQRLAMVYNQVKQEREMYETNKARVLSLAGNAELENVVSLLNVSAREAEEESDNIVEELLAKRITVQQFIEQFVEKRKLAYLRKIKAEKLQELLLKPQQSGTSTSSAPVTVSAPQRPPLPSVYQPPRY